MPRRWVYLLIYIFQCCGSGMFIPDPDFYPSRIPDLGSRIPDPGSKNSNKRERWKKISCHTFLCSHKFHKIVNYFSFEVLKNFQKALKNMVLGSGIRDPGSGKNLFRIPDPGVKKYPIPDPGSGSATLNYFPCCRIDFKIQWSSRLPKPSPSLLLTRHHFPQEWNLWSLFHVKLL
jgi:hypothetical protein